MTLTAKPLSEGFDAELEGLDLSQPIGEEARRGLLDLFWSYKVVAIRGQTVAPAGFLRFAEVFGTTVRSEERGVGQECVRTCRSRWSTSTYNTHNSQTK